jgi:hypothetical protein
MPISEEDLRVGRQRVGQIFRYLEALNNHRNPAKRHLDNQLWHLWFRDLPDHPSIRIATFAGSGDADLGDGVKSKSAGPNASGDYVVKVRRPKLTSCPSPPETLLPWLERGWQEPTNEPRLTQSRNELDDEGRTISVSFESDPIRPQVFEQWTSQRQVWVRN